MLAIGLMSGTSLDGVDSALVRITGQGENTQVELVGFLSMPMPVHMQKSILKVCDIEQSSVEQVCQLNFDLGYLFAEAAKQVCIEGNIPISDVDFIASHGQTIHHKKGSTLQIGESSVIAEQTNCLVISNFREMDIAAGGEGAPLVPYADYILYGEKGKSVAFNNIGGISNVTVLTGDNKKENVFAFDTGPGNMCINAACKMLFNKEYDEDGQYALKGKVIEQLLLELLDNPYFDREPPKSTGRELFGELYIKNIIAKYPQCNKYDIINTLTRFTAKSLADSYKNFILGRCKLDKIVITGGGAYNKALVEMIGEEIPEIDVVTFEQIGFSSDAKEAILFAVLGNEALHGIANNLPLCTGAKKTCVLGKFTFPPTGFGKFSISKV